MRIVLDANVLISMILGGRLQVLVDYWDQKRFVVLVSAEIMAEYAVVLARPKFGLPRTLQMPSYAALDSLPQTTHTRRHHSSGCLRPSRRIRLRRR